MGPYDPRIEMTRYTPLCATHEWISVCRHRRLAPEEHEPGCTHGGEYQSWHKTLTPPVLPTGVRTYTRVAENSKGDS